MAIAMQTFEIRNYLNTPEEQAAYIEAALEGGDPSFIAAALGDIARARGVTTFAAESGLSREAIYKAFRPGGNPTLETLAKATKALGLRLSVVAA
jgi:probable addiction module antidote protein